MTTFTTVTIIFHSQDAKRRFTKENSISSAEIIRETPTSITIHDDGTHWENNGWVYSVER